MAKETFTILIPRLYEAEEKYNNMKLEKTKFEAQIEIESEANNSVNAYNAPQLDKIVEWSNRIDELTNETDKIVVEIDETRDKIAEIVKISIHNPGHIEIGVDYKIDLRLLLTCNLSNEKKVNEIEVSQVSY